MGRSLRNLAWFLGAFALMFGLTLSAYASTASQVDIGTFPFDGDTCDDLKEGLTYAVNGKDGTPRGAQVIDVYSCSKQKLAAGNVIGVLYRRFDNTDSGSWTVTIESVDPVERQYDYLGFAALAVCFGLGVIAGKQR